MTKQQLSICVVIHQFDLLSEIRVMFKIFNKVMENVIESY